MSIARFAVNRPVAVIMRIAALVLLGLVCLTRLPVDLLPKVTLPSMSVVTQWPNVAPEEIEAQITRPVERAVSSVPGLYQVTSSSNQGVSQVRIQFQWGTDIGQAAVDVLQLVQRAKRSFPKDQTLQDPIVYKFDPTQMPILTFGVSGIKDPVKLRTLMDNHVSPMIESADGVASGCARIHSTSSGRSRRRQRAFVSSVVVVSCPPNRMRVHAPTSSISESPPIGEWTIAERTLEVGARRSRSMSWPK